ncbi:unnamed protein product [Lactuca saligna]|uniref:X8 domain-containing protein n=1 Tax=Lactuca saligna TaxID=75948 RepID=A0AA35YM34_LACSI|nr:unnamed protein product [Lactuca saligna]
MESRSLSLCFFSFLIVCSIYVEGKEWCVAQTHVSEERLIQFMNDKCLYIDCRPITWGGSCYEPNTVQNHASYAIDLNFRVNGECDPSFATIAVTDPSFRSCVYP